MEPIKPMLWTCLKNYSAKDLTSDVVSGIIVAVIALPLSIALALASGVGPEEGLYTAIIAGFLISAFGGSKVQIAGPTAAFATIVAGIVASAGLSGLMVATVMAGILLILMGVLRLGKLIRFIPGTITIGFTAGIAVTILIGQLKDFFGLTYPAGTVTIETVEKIEAVAKNFGTLNPWALAVGAISLAILILWPKVSAKIPASLIAVL
ncbi:MAG: sodium-independent anion transporter, partial [Firmicutes bacterium]|nr:sodium-independent anion transporter [Bacillota bacterium]